MSTRSHTKRLDTLRTMQEYLKHEERIEREMLDAKVRLRKLQIEKEIILAETEAASTSFGEGSTTSELMERFLSDIDHVGQQDDNGLQALAEACELQSRRRNEAAYDGQPYVPPTHLPSSSTPVSGPPASHAQLLVAPRVDYATSTSAVVSRVDSVVTSPPVTSHAYYAAQLPALVSRVDSVITSSPVASRADYATQLPALVSGVYSPAMSHPVASHAYHAPIVASRVDSYVASPSVSSRAEYISTAPPVMSYMDSFVPRPSVMQPVGHAASTTPIVSSRMDTNAIPPPVASFCGPGAAQPDPNYAQTDHPDTTFQTQSQFQALLSTFAQQVSISRLPPPEPGTFNGDPLTFPVWKTAFETLINGRGISPAEAVHYLKRYLSGTAKEAVEGYLMVPGPDAFATAWSLLQKRFGDPFVVANAFRDKLESWPKISGKDTKGLRKYADFLRQCHAAMEVAGSQLGILNDERENSKLAAKLPNWLIKIWGREAHRWKMQVNSFPPFLTFVAFVDKEADIANDPVTSLSAIQRNTESKTQGKGQPQKTSKGQTVTNFATASKSSQPNESKASSAVRKCLLCTGDHSLDNCPDFLSKPLQDKETFVRENRLCWGCFGKGHRSKDCRKRLKCTTCGQLHPTSLHRAKTRENESQGQQGKEKETENTQAKKDFPKRASCNHLSTSSAAKSSMIIPMWISHKDNPSAEILVYGILDTQSDTTFVLTEVSKRLGVTGTDCTLLLSTMYAADQPIKSTRITGLEVRGLNKEIRIPLPATYARDIIPANDSHIPTPEMAKEWPHLERIASCLHPRQECPIALLIGYNCSQALVPRQVIAATSNEPYAQRTDLGWGIVGVIEPQSVEMEDEYGTSYHVVTYAHVMHLATEEKKETPVTHVIQERSIAIQSKIKEVLRVLESDFHERDGEEYSIEDRKFLQIVEDGIVQRSDQHFEMPLPFRKSDPSMPESRSQAMKRLSSLKRKFEKDQQYKEDYTKFMSKVIESGFAEKVPEEDLGGQVHESGRCWYIPHFGIYNPKKPSKIRVVFDCSAKCKGVSLNDELLQGPDLTNSLFGVLCRFRQENVAVACDVEQMFHQFYVTERHRNYLRFLWWVNGDTTRDPTEMRMAVHCFGASSSPSCCSFGLKKIADTYEDQFGKDAADFVRHDFYVDDGLSAKKEVGETKSLLRNTRELCKKGGLRLHKIISNSREVVESVPPEDRAESGVSLPGQVQGPAGIPVEKALGVHWCIQDDTLQFRITLMDKPLTRRGVLSSIGSIYDPLGFVAPVLLEGRLILQELCRQEANWDDPLPSNLRARWERWRGDLPKLEDIAIRRCLKPPAEFGEIETIEFHHFADASYTGYSQCSYTRMLNSQGQVHCSFITGKSRVAPLKTMTIPRLELTAAVVSANMSYVLKRELDYKISSETFWSDSQVALGYIKNQEKRFHVFVANRVQAIREKTEPSQWRHVAGENNPADEGSRGLTPDQLASSAKWLTGPDFLWEETIPMEDTVDSHRLVCDEDPEVKRVKVNVFATGVAQVAPKFGSERLDHFSSWDHARRAIAAILQLKTRLRQRVKPDGRKPLNTQTLYDAEREIIKTVQNEFFEQEIGILKELRAAGGDEFQGQGEARARNVTLKKTSCLYRLDPFLDDEGILRVGGRIRRAEINKEQKHPAILPRNAHVTVLILRHAHEKVGHGGRGSTLNWIRQNGYWIIGARRMTSSLIFNCVTCRKLKRDVQQQKMADLPADRLIPAPSFTYCGIDVFGPWLIKEGRSRVKRYGLIVTCLVMRAVHIETLNAMTTDSFINGLRRLIAIRGPVKLIRCDQGTNFVGAQNELREAWSEMDFEVVRKFLLKEECDVEFRMNVPAASHRGGVWERQIRSVRSILSAMLLESGEQLDDESLRTLLYEVMAVVNGRPLCVDNLEDPTSLLPLTPNLLLTMKSRILVPPPGNFPREDLHLRKRWRRVQHLANYFWDRWRKEYVHNLQARQKWNETSENLEVGDIVTLKDEQLPRNLWRLARIEEVKIDDDNRVRTVRIAIGDKTLDRQGRRQQELTFLERPVQKVVLICKDDSQTQ